MRKGVLQTKRRWFGGSLAKDFSAQAKEKKESSREPMKEGEKEPKKGKERN